jgi:hypothetical protein
VLRIRTRDPGSVAFLTPGSGAFLTSGSGMGKKSGSGSGMNYPDLISETIFWDKIFKIFDANWDPGWKKFGSGIGGNIRIRDKHPGSATLVKCTA